MTDVQSAIDFVVLCNHFRVHGASVRAFDHFFNTRKKNSASISLLIFFLDLQYV